MRKLARTKTVTANERCRLATAKVIRVLRDQIPRKPIGILIVDDSIKDAGTIERELTRSGYDVTALRVARAAGFAEALAGGNWDVIVASYTISGFGAIAALKLLKQSGRDIPFLIVSGSTTDEIAVASLWAGAQDYVAKENLARLVPAIEPRCRKRRPPAKSARGYGRPLSQRNCGIVR